MGGHYPPVCYRANGWVLTEGGMREHDWKVGGMDIPGKEYIFRSGDFEDQSTIVVMNFILRPDGLIERDVYGLRQAGYDPRKKPFGGGQVQLLLDSRVEASVRDQVFETIIEACLPAIREIISGVTE